MKPREYFLCSKKTKITLFHNLFSFVSVFDTHSQEYHDACCCMDYFNDVITTFLGLEHCSCVYAGSESSWISKISSWIRVLKINDKRWGWVINDRIFIFRCIIPLIQNTAFTYKQDWHNSVFEKLLQINFKCGFTLNWPHPHSEKLSVLPPLSISLPVCIKGL